MKTARRRATKSWYNDNSWSIKDTRWKKSIPSLTSDKPDCTNVHNYLSRLSIARSWHIFRSLTNVIAGMWDKLGLTLKTRKLTAIRNDAIKLNMFLVGEILSLVQTHFWVSWRHKSRNKMLTAADFFIVDDFSLSSVSSLINAKIIHARVNDLRWHEKLGFSLYFSFDFSTVGESSEHCKSVEKMRSSKLKKDFA